MPKNDATTPGRDLLAETVSVLLPLPVPGPYDYRVPAGMAAGPGAIVRVPLGSREVTGVVWGAATGEVGHNRLKEILEVRDVPPLGEALRSFVSWVARYTVNPEGAVLRMVLRAPGALDPPRPRIAWRATGQEPERLTEGRRRVLDLLADGMPRGQAEIAAEAGVGTGVVKGLADGGILQQVLLPAHGRRRQPDPETPGPVLSGDQAGAAAELAGAVTRGGFEAFVLEGVTGSGKTEVYFDAIAAALRAGRQALVLLPEIALSAQVLDRFAERFAAPPAMWHSDVPSRLRRETWRGVATGEVRVVVGARSALFLPFADLGLIVVDEEHDASFKQDDGVCYHARDMAVVRASLEDIPVVLSSATPSLETLVNVDRGRYRELVLASRHGGAQMPQVETIDMTRAGTERGRWLSPPLVAALTETLEAGEQALLFLNRRGYAPLTLCRTCGHRFACPNCTAWLVEHRHLGRLQCHHCGLSIAPPQSCPSCGAEDSLVACGPGVERLAEEVAERFPQARCEIMASDTMLGPDAASALIARVEAHEIDILIGTQVAAKGHHFPMLTVVGVVDADLGLDGGDPRAMERTWQLLHQVSGRAGRAERPGKVYLQTYEPRHPVMAALVSGDREHFLAREKAERERAAMPPFGRLAGIVVSGTDEGEVRRLANGLARRGPRGEGIETFGPAPAPLSLLRGRFRWRLLVKARRDVNLQGALRAWLDPVKTTGSLRIQIDVDPLSFL